MKTQNTRIMEDQLVELSKDRFFITPTGEIAKCNDDGDLMVGYFGKEVATFKTSAEAEKTKKALKYNLKYLGFVEETEDGEEYYYSTGEEQDAEEEIYEIEDEFAEAYALIRQYQENGFKPNMMQFKAWSAMMKDLSKQSKEKIEEHLGKMQAFLIKHKADNDAVLDELQEIEEEQSEEVTEKDLKKEAELRASFKKGFKLINLLKDEGVKVNPIQYKAWGATFNNIDEAPVDEVNTNLGKMRAFAEKHKELIIEMNNREASKSKKESQTKDKKESGKSPAPHKPMFPATIKHKDAESGETNTLVLATGKYKDFDEVREALVSGESLMFVNYITPQDIEDFDLINAFGINDIKKFPSNLDITEVLYLCESIDKVHTVSPLTEAVYYYFYDTLEEVKEGKDVVRYNIDMPYQIYEVK